jgi:hypothetical protein
MARLMQCIEASTLTEVENGTKGKDDVRQGDGDDVL